MRDVIACMCLAQHMCASCMCVCRWLRYTQCPLPDARHAHKMHLLTHGKNQLLCTKPAAGLWCIHQSVSQGSRAVACRWPGAIGGVVCSSSSAGGCSQCTQSIADFTSLLAEMRAAMGPSMLLTVALRATPTPQLHYQLDQIVQSVDWINLMSYDYVS